MKKVRALPYLKKEVRRDERWFAMALPGCFDPFGLRVISGMDAGGCCPVSSYCVTNGSCHETGEW